MVLIINLSLFFISVGFPTYPKDSTGIAHILEHIVLCGSRQYPVRDPFFKMLTRSLATFMNAFTGKPAYVMYNTEINSIVYCCSFFSLQLVTGQCILFVHKMKETFTIFYLYTWILCCFLSYVLPISGTIQLEIFDQ